jgi:hypothetical protein
MKPDSLPAFTGVDTDRWMELKGVVVTRPGIPLPEQAMGFLKKILGLVGRPGYQNQESAESVGGSGKCSGIQCECVC